MRAQYSHSARLVFIGHVAGKNPSLLLMCSAITPQSLRTNYKSFRSKWVNTEDDADWTHVIMARYKKNLMTLAV